METQSEEQQAHEEPVALAVSVDDFSALEERVRRAVEMVKRERQARAAAEARVAELESRATDSEARATLPRRNSTRNRLWWSSSKAN